MGGAHGGSYPRRCILCQSTSVKLAGQFMYIEKRGPFSASQASTYCDGGTWASDYRAGRVRSSMDDCKDACSRSSSCLGISFGTHGANSARYCVLCTTLALRVDPEWIY